MIGTAGAERRSEDAVSRKLQDCIGDVLLCGFEGNNASSASAQVLAQQIRDEHASGVVFVKDNIGNEADVIGLTKLFSDNAPRKPILAIDHEGGAVQRLVAAHGCAVLPTAEQVAKSYSPEDAQKLYEGAGHALARLGFNLNLAPVVDLHDPRNPAIGHFGRAFSTDPRTVTGYARAFIAGCTAAGVACALKHFPGQGGALDDPHMALPDIASTWSDRDLSPFRDLIHEGCVAAIMIGHSVHDVGTTEKQPAIFSRAIITDTLRGELGFGGVALTDDLDMGAVGYGYERRKAVRRALSAGNDLLIVRNRRNYDPDLPASLAGWISEGLESGELSMDEINRSVSRVRAFRAKISI